MITNYQISTGADVGTLFKLRKEGDPKIENTGIKIADGRDFSDIFLPYIDGVQVEKTKMYVANGQDISELFCRK